jgi:hypothetical protein
LNINSGRLVTITPEQEAAQQAENETIRNLVILRYI